MVAARQGGFTLVEAIIALTLSSVLVVLVSSVFLVQNQYYAVQLERTAAQDNARMITELMGSEIRSVMQGGVKTAENDRLVVRSPIVLGIVCGHPGSNRVSVQFDGGLEELITDEVSGIAMLDTSTGEWDYQNASWSRFYASGGSPAAECYSNGADTVGARGDFHNMRRLNGYFGSLPDIGSVLMLYREVEYEFNTSEMDGSTLALFRAVGNDDPVEMITGVNTTAEFKYRTGGSTYASSVGGSSTVNIDAIRIEAQARRRPLTGGVDDVTFGWGVNVYLRNGS